MHQTFLKFIFLIFQKVKFCANTTQPCNLRQKCLIFHRHFIKEKYYDSYASCLSKYHFSQSSSWKYPNEEVDCTESSLSVSVPRFLYLATARFEPSIAGLVVDCSTTMLPSLAFIILLSPCVNDRILTHDLMIMSRVFYPYATAAILNMNILCHKMSNIQIYKAAEAKKVAKKH